MKNLATLVLGLAGLGAAQDAAPVPQDVLTLGVYTSEQPRVMFKKFAPVAKALERGLRACGAEDTVVELRIFKTYDEARTALVEGSIDLARFGPASYVLAKDAQPKLRVAAVETIDGQLTFEGYIAVPRTSPIETLAQLRGKRFAFGDPTSTIGRYLSQEVLLNAGLHVTDFSEHAYLGRHDKVFHVVAKGEFDAGALKADTFEKLNTKRELRVLARFDNVTKPWVVRAGMDDGFFAQVQSALLMLDDQVALRTLKVSGFAKVREHHFDATRRGMAAAQRFCAPRPGPGKD